MKAIIQSLFGYYQPVYDYVSEYIWNPVTEQFDTFTNTVTVNGLGGLDWEWIAGVFLFGLSLWCIFKIIGGLICGRF